MEWKTKSLGLHKETSMDLEDICVWADDTWCYRYEVEEMSHMSDDYQILFFDTEPYNRFLLAHC
jgi:hypothetical protein